MTKIIQFEKILIQVVPLWEIKQEFYLKNIELELKIIDQYSTPRETIKRHENIKKYVNMIRCIKCDKTILIPRINLN